MAQNNASPAANHDTHMNSGGVAGTKPTHTADMIAKKAARLPIVRRMALPVRRSGMEGIPATPR